MRRVQVLSLVLLLAGCARARASTSTSTDPAPTTAAVPSAGASALASADASADAGGRDAESVPPYTGPRSPPLRNASLRSPMPGGYLGGWQGDTGLDIAGNELEVFAIGAGTLDYSEWGHTLWTRGRDTAYSIRLALDEPIPWGDRLVTHVYYTHLSKVETLQEEGAPLKKHVEAGERIGVSGIANGVPHLHLGLLLDDQVEQDSWTFILREGDIRKLMGNYENGERLPLK